MYLLLNQIKKNETYVIQEEPQLIAVCRKGGCSASYNSFVVGSIETLSTLFLGKLRPDIKRHLSIEMKETSEHVRKTIN
jgi:hypothetical protein